MAETHEEGLGELRRLFLDGGRVEPDGRNGRGARTIRLLRRHELFLCFLPTDCRCPL